MNLWDGIKHFLALEPLQTRDFDPTPASLATQIANIRRTTQAAARPWRLPSITEALGVPAIQRAVTLIANTTGSLAVQGYRNGAAMTDPPRLIIRPDPYNTPRDFYRDWAYGLASRGEGLHYIASRDIDGLASALVMVPATEWTVEDNPRNRLFPIYTWGDIKGTRYSAANPSGVFVHSTYMKLGPLDLHGVGPLQLAGAAMSVAVESQEWAANFYADGGNGGTLIKAANELGIGPEEAETEAEKLRAQWVGKPNNIPRVIDPNIESVTSLDVNPQGAQMLDARDYQNGDAARTFGIPGALLEYATSGSSLTYQNLAEVWTNFVRGCLTINYLEPIEQALTDLLPRTTVARFNIRGLMRADIKTRYDVYSIDIDKSIITPEQARQEEGYDPGDIEFAPVPFSPPTAVPSSLPQVRSASDLLPEQMRCDGVRTRRRSGVTRLETCNAKLLRSWTGPCPRCKKMYPAA